MKIRYYKISYIVFYILMAISAVIFALFVFVGYDHTTMLPNGTAPIGDPQFTDLLIYWMYALTGICILCAIGAALYQFVVGMKHNAAKTLRSLLGIVLIIALIFVAYLLSSNAPLPMSDGTIYEDKFNLVLSDVVLFTQYVLIGVAVICSIISLTGFVRNSNKITTK